MFTILFLVKVNYPRWTRLNVNICMKCSCAVPTLLRHIFLKKWATPGLFFVYFRSFQTNNTIFTTNQCEKTSCPSRIRRWDSNPRPTAYFEPVLSLLWFYFNESSRRLFSLSFVFSNIANNLATNEYEKFSILHL